MMPLRLRAKTSDGKVTTDNVIKLDDAIAARSTDKAKSSYTGGRDGQAALGFGVAAATAAHRPQGTRPGGHCNGPASTACSIGADLPQVDLFLHQLSELKRFIA